MYFVVYVPRSSFRAHNPYGVLFLSEVPVALYHFDRKLYLRGITILYKIHRKYLSLKRIKAESTVITACGEKPEESKRYTLIAENYGKAIPVPEHLASWNFPQTLYLRKEVDCNDNSYEYENNLLYFSITHIYTLTENLK